MIPQANLTPRHAPYLTGRDETPLTPKPVGQKPIIILFADDSTLFFARRMRDVLRATPGAPPVLMGWLNDEDALSYRQMQETLPEGPDLAIPNKTVGRLVTATDVGAVLTSRVFSPLRNALLVRTRKYAGPRPCVIGFLGGLDFFPGNGYMRRRHCDAVYVVPRSEAAVFSEMMAGQDVGWQEVGFGHPTFLRPGPWRGDPGGGAQTGLDGSGADAPGSGASGSGAPEAEGGTGAHTGPETGHERRDIYFFTQALSPATRRGRMHMLEVMAALARAYPERDVWIKLRHLPHENRSHLHRERYDYASLMQHLSDVPPNLKLTACTMDEALAGAAFGITCTSTAAIDVVRAGVPCMVHLDYVDNYRDGLMPHMRRLFQGSGLITGLEDLLALRAPPPNPDWVANMFCPPDLGAQVLETIARFDARPGQIRHEVPPISR